MLKLSQKKNQIILKLLAIIITAVIAVFFASLSLNAQTHFQLLPPYGCGEVQLSAQSNLSAAGYTPVPQQTTGIAFFWDFGNGQTSIAQNPTGVNYDLPGDYTISYTATIDTIGYFLTAVDLTAVTCDDPFGGAPDMYIIIVDGSSQVVYTTQSSPYSDTSPPVNWALNLHLNNPPYSFWIWDEDSFDNDDNCVDDSESQPGVSTPVQLPANNQSGFGVTSYSSVNGGLQYTLHFYKEVYEITEDYTYTVYNIPVQPVLSILNEWYCEGQLVPEISAMHNPGYIVNWFSDSLLNYHMHTGSDYTMPLSPNGTYNFYVTQTDTATGCESLPAVATVTIGKLPAPYVMNGNRIFCEGEVLSHLIVDEHNVSWFSDSLLTNLLHEGDTLELNMIQPGVYSFWVVYENVEGCESEAAYVTVTIAPRLEVDIEVESVSCAGYSDGTAQVNHLNGYPPFSYLWSNGQTTQTATNLSVGNATVIVVDSVYCLRSFIVYIEDRDSLIISANVTGVSCIEHGPRGNIAIVVTGGTEPYEIMWNNSIGGMELFDLEQGEYNLVVSDAENCVLDSVFVVNVNDDCLIVATVLTPNGDVKNDTWMIQSIEFFPEVLIQVFDRHGSVVFSSQGEYTPWDGTFNGKPLPVGSYFYTIQLSPSHDVQSGVIDIIR
jgi:gliding motility-associated-like protein